MGHPEGQPRGPATQHLCPSTLRGPCTQWATTGAPDVFSRAASARRGSGTRGANPGPLRHLAVVRLRPGDPAPRGPPLGPVRSRAPRPHARGNAARQVVDGLWTGVCRQEIQSNDPRYNQHNPQYANYWAPLTRKRHIPPHPAQLRHTNYWALRTRKRHQREHQPQRPTERSDPTQHAKGRPGDCPGPCKGTTTRRNVTRGGGGGNPWPMQTLCDLPCGWHSGGHGAFGRGFQCGRYRRPATAVRLPVGTPGTSA